jgi:hypothetical protein
VIQTKCITQLYNYFSFPLWLIIDVSSVFGLLPIVVVGDVVDVSEVHDASIFRVKVCRLVS